MFLNEKLNEGDLKGSHLCTAGISTLAYMRDNGGIQLTKSGAFKRKFVVWAVDAFQWPGYTPEELYRINKVLNEDDVTPISYLHVLLLSARLIRHAKGKAVLTKAGAAVLGNYGRLHARMFETFFTRFDFAALERWPIELADADTMHSLGVVRNRLNDWVAYPEFTGWCLPVLALEPQRGMAEEDAMFYLATRFVRPLHWLGLIEVDEPRRYPPISEVQLRKTPLFDRFLRIEMIQQNEGRVH